ncbi:MAG: single-stranded DNA-binding protein, partial [Planctomycetota bacterium]
TRQKRDQLAEICDRHLKSVIDCFDQLEHVVGIGTYAANCFQRIELSSDIKQTRILHPSPASPAANRDWPGTVRAQLREAQVWGCHSS